MPTEMVVLTNTAHLEVISTITGRVIRTLASDVALYRGTPSMTVSPSGVVYFDDAETVNGEPTERILDVPVAGGPITTLAEGHAPVMSPNGHLLAYLTYTDLSGTPEGIAVRDLLTGTTTKWAYSTTLPDIGRLSWAPDSRSLSFTSTAPGEHNTSPLVLRAFVLDVQGASGPLDGARQIPLPTGMSWAGYLNQTQGIGLVQHAGLNRRSNWFEISEVEVRSGRIVKRLATFPGSLAVDNVYDGAEGTLQMDPSHRYLSIAETGSGNWSLYRWKIASGPALRIATGVIAGAWVPVSAGAA
jgi:hypothetical protein